MHLSQSVQPSPYYRGHLFKPYREIARDPVAVTLDTLSRILPAGPKRRIGRS